MYKVTTVREPSGIIDIAMVYLCWAEELQASCSLEYFVASLGVGQSHTTAFVLWHKMEPVGFVHGELQFGPVEPYCVAYSHYFYVKPEHRSMSGRLWRKLLTWAKGNGADSLRTVSGDEETSLRWQRHQFVPCAVLLERKL